MHTTDAYTATQEENKPPVLRMALRNAHCGKQCNPSCKPASVFLLQYTKVPAAPSLLLDKPLPPGKVVPWCPSSLGPTACLGAAVLSWQLHTAPWQHVPGLSWTVLLSRKGLIPLYKSKARYQSFSLCWSKPQQHSRAWRHSVSVHGQVCLQPLGTGPGCCM